MSKIRQVNLSLRAYCRSYLNNVLGAARAELKGYWKVYGGIRAIARSPALILALFITLICYPFWWNDPWVDTTISIIPNLLGFTLGAMAIVLAFPSSQLFAIIAEGGRDDSYYIDLAAKFLHFIFVQIFAIILAVIGKAYSGKILAFVGVTCLIYAILCAALTALALFGVAQINNHPGAVKMVRDESRKG